MESHWEEGVVVPVHDHNQVPDAPDDGSRWLWGLDGEAHECGPDVTGLIVAETEPGVLGWQCREGEVPDLAWTEGDVVAVFSTDLPPVEEHPDHRFVYAAPDGSILACREQVDAFEYVSVEMGDDSSQLLWACDGGDTILYGHFAFG